MITRDRRVLINWNNFIDIWKMGYKIGYSKGYTDLGDGIDYNDDRYQDANPPGILKKLFESYLPEQEEEE